MSSATRNTIRSELESARRELLDLGLRNPLLNYQTFKARGLDITDELPAQVYEVLVGERRLMSFLPIPDFDEEEELFEPSLFENDEYQGDLSALLTQPEEAGEEGTASRHTDSRLQTPYTPSKLQSRLLATFYAARTFVEEQGVNVLYLALGMLEWYEDLSSDKRRRAPLLLVPVELTRTDVRARFRLSYTDEEVGGNLSLQAKLKAEFGLSLPLPDPEAELDIEAYFDRIGDVIDETPRWRVDREAVHLGFFLFGKLLMYNDLDVTEWPDGTSPLDHDIIGAILGDGFPPATDRLSDEEHLDRHLHPDEVHQVVDADGSQTLALLDVKRGNNLVIQGPPGTGKSQTITNIIAEAIGQGKSVLFVAEKMAALEVVKRRLNGVHLGDACLELHSHKTSKKKLLAELERTINLGRPMSEALHTDLDVLIDARDQLNAYAAAVYESIGETGVRPYDAYGELLLQRQRWNGVEPPGASDRDMESWTASDCARRRAKVVQMQTLVADIGRPTEHPFWGSNRKAFLPSEQQSVERTASEASTSIESLSEAVRPLSDFLHLDAETPADADVLTRAARRALAAPDLRGVRVDAGEWHARRSDVAELVRVGTAYDAVRAEYNEVLIPEAWKEDVLETRQHLKAHGEKWYRIFIGDWRRAKSRLAGLIETPIPTGHDERLAIVDGIREAQRLRKEIDAYASLGSGLFGLQWEGAASDWAVLERIASWMTSLHGDVASGKVPRGLVAFLAGGPDLDALEPLAENVEGRLKSFGERMQKAVDIVAFVAERRYGEGETIDMQPLHVLAALAKGWAKQAARLQEIVTFNHQVDAFAEDSLILFAGLATNWEHAATHLSDAFDYVWYSTLVDVAFTERPALARFNSALHGEALRRFIDRDEIALAYNRVRLALEHWQNLPRNGTAASAAGQLGVLYHEFGKKRRYLPIRKLMTVAGRAVQAIKPVFMMSPMSIATYLPPGTVDFDLVVFDEASQVKPVDAFGAILRGRQAVVVGDSKQLPPTSFFDSVVGDADDEDFSDTADIESILELFKSKRAPERMLNWHYRSRHESLIAVSNQEFYENRLVIFPSPDAGKAEVGLVYHHLPETTYDKGGRRSNRKEAKAVAKAVMRHAKSTPELSLMVATFSQAQQKEVRDQVDLLCLQDPELNYFANRRDVIERFDVKNLENVQGDERDVVFISVGYGRDQHGAVSMNFGPLNREGGERRLNVLISRARRRCEVFTNLRADDIDLGRTDARGVAAFKRYLQYAETGVLEMDKPTGREPDSPFEVAVAKALRTLGYRVEYQIGVGGFRIDLAVVDPERPGRYLLGIECDGATYHSARTARDRDRIRQSVLEGLGWRIHRIWSTNWFRYPQSEVKRVVAAIERAKAEPVDRSPPRRTVDMPSLERADKPLEKRAPVPTEPYVKAKLRGHLEPLHEVPKHILAGDVGHVVRVESPVHFDEVARRILDASGVSRLGSRIRKAIESATLLAEARNGIVRRGDFLYLSSQKRADVPVRERSDLSAGSRKFDFIAPEEVRAAIAEVISSSFGIAAEDLALEVCRMFGFGQTSEQMRVAVAGALADMQSAGTVAERHGMLALTNLNATDYDVQF
ncbi:MAG: DUF3320 domain-containing protein [Bacteroidota bacterium]